MGEKPKRKRGAGKIYRPSLLLRAVNAAFLVIGIPYYLLWNSFFLERPTILMVIPMLIGVLVMGIPLWFSYQVVFRLRFVIRPEGGEYHGFGYKIRFRWEDARRVEVTRVGQRRGWYLVMASTAEIKKPKWSWFVGWFYKSLETFIPLGDFIPITAVRLFSVDFWATPLGNEMRQFAPHLYTPYWLSEQRKLKR